MNSSNVDFYIAGFGADGKRVGSIICDFNPEKNPKKLKEALAEAKEKFPEAVVVEPIGADAFNQYLDGYIRGADGKPIKYEELGITDSGNSRELHNATAVIMSRIGDIWELDEK